jgi:hypothetical protein
MDGLTGPLDGSLGSAAQGSTQPVVRLSPEDPFDLEAYVSGVTGRFLSSTSSLRE